ncbi:Uncharacterised protein [Mycobacterium tuberculosis]|nr:Uncharacterised protein [Mycobacterium tuberculosis]
MPACLKTSLPFLKAISVGNNLTPAIEARSFSVSMLTLPCTTSKCFRDDAS